MHFAGLGMPHAARAASNRGGRDITIPGDWWRRRTLRVLRRRSACCVDGEDSEDLSRARIPHADGVERGVKCSSFAS